MKVVCEEVSKILRSWLVRITVVWSHHDVIDYLPIEIAQLGTMFACTHTSLYKSHDHSTNSYDCDSSSFSLRKISVCFSHAKWKNQKSFKITKGNILRCSFVSLAHFTFGYSQLNDPNPWQWYRFLRFVAISWDIGSELWDRNPMGNLGYGFAKK